MTWRHIIVYWAAAGALAGWLYVQSQAPASVPAATAATAPLLSAPLERFDGIVILRGADELVFRRDGTRWQQTAPPGLQVTSDLVAALLDTLSTIPPIERLENENVTSPQFGLSPPEARIQLRSAGEVAIEVEIGRRNATRTAAYAAVAGKGDVYLIGLNAQYYFELIFDEVARQMASRES